MAIRNTMDQFYIQDVSIRAFESVNFESCQFLANIGSFSGAIFVDKQFNALASNYDSRSDSSLIHISIKNCIFTGNGSTDGTGAVRINTTS